MSTDRLPYLDEHATEVEAGVEEVWPALLDAVDRAFSGAATRWYARAVGCAPHAAGGPRPLAEGSTIPGFRVAGAVPGRELVLDGRHRFSDYALIFRLDDTGAGRSRLRAESRATFPGIGGGVYRLLVVGTRGHVAGVRGLLATVRRTAEQRARPPS